IGKRRGELYHWLTRADVIATTNGANLGDIKQPLVIYYDVYLINEFYPNQFYGAGGACDRQPSSDFIFPCPTIDSGSGTPIDTLDCYSSVIISPPSSTGDDSSIRLPGSVDCESFGIDCTIKGPCKPVSRGLDCPLSGGRTLRLFKLGSVRPQVGCASLNSGKSKIGPDSKGYSFILTVRTVSIGSSYN
ncbi:MAG: hypothetical protein HY819_17265, partial [Acidobacteria bacterium]|nr:hypothetical protein [Acidobacteriota bacterium]